MFRYCFALSFCCLGLFSIAGNTKISGIINLYAGLNNVSNDTLTLTSTTGFSVGDNVLIIQMQGATIDETNSANYGDIINLNDAGNYEFTTICKKLSNNQIIVKCIERSYDPAGVVQVVQVPVYEDAEIVNTLTAQSWDGTTGGVLAFECTGTLTMSKGINLQGVGFRGGATTTSKYSCVWFINVRDYHSNISDGIGAQKGEGIAKYISGKTAGRGAQANGGGGGNDHNSGGGGGGNASAGGLGGERIAESAFNCRAVAPGNGGKPNTYTNTNNRIFLGGGGGAGHENNANAASAGGSGGGIVLIKAKSIIGNGNTINISGENISKLAADGSGGGGAGGTVLLQVATYLGNLTITNNGGDGGDVANTTTINCNGPGGGGSGGVLWLSQDTIPVNLTINKEGGSAGVILSTGQSNCTIGGTNNAKNGESGIVLTDLKLFESNCHITPTIQNKTICAFDSISVGGEWQFTSGVYYDTISLDCKDSLIETRLTVLEEKSSTVSTSICDGDSFVINGHVYKNTTKGVLERFINIGPFGCDSLVTLNVTVNTVDTTVSRPANNLLKSNAIGVDYQWINCNDNSPIIGAIDSNFSTLKSGNYAAVVTQKGCIDTSECFKITIEEEGVNKIKIYPNPTTGDYTIDLGEKLQKVEILTYDLSGRLVASKVFYESELLNLTLNYAAGLYQVVIDDGVNRTVLPIIKM